MIILKYVVNSLLMKEYVGRVTFCSFRVSTEIYLVLVERDKIRPVGGKGHWKHV